MENYFRFLIIHNYWRELRGIVSLAREEEYSPRRHGGTEANSPALATRQTTVFKKSLFAVSHSQFERVSAPPWVGGLSFFLSCAILLSFISTAFSQTSIEALLAPWEPNQHLESDSDLRLFSSGHEKESGSHIQLTQFDSEGRYRLDDSRPINPTISYEAHYLHIAADHLPDQLADLSLGFSSPIAGDESLFLAGAASVGYAGANPFSNARALYGQATLLVGHSFDDTRTLLFLVDYDGNRTLFPDIPIPAVEYIDQSNPNFIVVLGLPVDLLYWKPFSDLEILLNLVIPNSLALEIDYHLTKQWTLYTTFGDDSNRYAVDDLPHNRRLIFQQTRLGAGISYQPIKYAEFTLGVGYAFAQRFGVGFDERELRNKIDLTDEPYLRFGIDITW